jgi:hypothetical protein
LPCGSGLALAGGKFRHTHRKLKNASVFCLPMEGIFNNITKKFTNQSFKFLQTNMLMEDEIFFNLKN